MHMHSDCLTFTNLNVASGEPERSGKVAPHGKVAGLVTTAAVVHL